MKIRKHAVSVIMLGLMVLSLTLALAANVSPVRAQGGGEFEPPPGVTWDEINGVAKKMYCDVCEGVPLDECESIACRQWREEIARQLGEGRDEDQIIDFFVERYGADVAAIPRDTMDRLLAFAVPAVILLAISIIGGMQIQQMRRKGRQSGKVMRRSGRRLTERPVPDDIDPQLLERLEQDLQGLE